MTREEARLNSTQWELLYQAENNHHGPKFNAFIVLMHTSPYHFISTMS